MLFRSDSSQASIAGKGVSSNSGHTITYDCGAEHQVIMCVYHSVPMLDWNLTGQAPQLTVTSVSDFPQPAFDRLGMQAVPAYNLQNNPGRGPSGSSVIVNNANSSSSDRYLNVNSDLYRDWETDRKSTRLNSSHSGESRMPSSA